MEVRKGTFGKISDLGLVLVLELQNDSAKVKVLDGEHAGSTDEQPARFIEQIDRETLDAARKLAAEKYGYKPEPRRERHQVELPWLGAITGMENVRMWVEQDRGNLVLRIQEFSENAMGVAPRTAELALPAKGSPSWVDRVLDEETGKPTGASLTNTRLVIVLKK